MKFETKSEPVSIRDKAYKLCLKLKRIDENGKILTGKFAGGQVIVRESKPDKNGKTKKSYVLGNSTYKIPVDAEATQDCIEKDWKRVADAIALYEGTTTKNADRAEYNREENTKKAELEAKKRALADECNKQVNEALAKGDKDRAIRILTAYNDQISKL